MSKTSVVKFYKARSAAPNLRLSKIRHCEDCAHIEQDSEMDVCGKYRGVCHDMDMSEDLEFAHKLICDDFTGNH